MTALPVAVRSRGEIEAASKPSRLAAVCITLPEGPNTCIRREMGGGQNLLVICEGEARGFLRKRLLMRYLCVEFLAAGDQGSGLADGADELAFHALGELDADG